MDTGADITNLLTEAMNDPDVPDLFADQHRELLLRVRDAYDERWTIMITELMNQDKQNYDYIYELYLDTSKALHDDIQDIHVTNCEFGVEPMAKAAGHAADLGRRRRNSGEEAGHSCGSRPPASRQWRT